MGRKNQIKQTNTGFTVFQLNLVMLCIAMYMMCRHAGVTASSIRQRQKGKLEKMG